MKRSFVWLAVLLGIFVVGVAAISMKNTREAPPLPRPIAGDVGATIEYTTDGYVPQEVTVRRGHAVRWVNSAGTDMWPASAVHPTHSLYPEKSESDCLGSSFDACREMPPGSTWEFTFLEVGDWKFHDHIRPSRAGAVHVTK